MTTDKPPLGGPLPYAQLAREAGFAVREMEERFVDEAWLAVMPQYERYLGWPITHFWAFER